MHGHPSLASFSGDDDNDDDDNVDDVDDDNVVVSYSVTSESRAGAAAFVSIQCSSPRLVVAKQRRTYQNSRHY
jgi:hypothetical protein